MEESGLVGIATYVMRGKQQLGCLRVRDGVIVLEKMFFADEIRPAKEFKPRKQAVGKQELELALDLVDRFRSHFDPEKYEDTYRAALLAVIDRKRKGKGVHVEPQAEEREEPADLLAALRASVEEHSRGARKGRRGNGSLDALSKAELEQRARKAGIRGRSSMTKDELVEALTAA
jgi:DNA end-binding protein Ku